MAVNDRIAFIGAAGGLVNALGIERDHMQLAGKPVVEGFQTLRVDIAGSRYFRYRASGLLRCRQGLFNAFGVTLKIERIELATLCHPRQQAIK